MFCLYTLPLAKPAQAKIQMLTAICSIVTLIPWNKLIWVIFKLPVPPFLCASLYFWFWARVPPARRASAAGTHCRAQPSPPRRAIPTGWTDWEIDCGPLLFGLLAKELGIIEQTSRRQHVCECIDIYWLLLPSSCCCLAARCSLDILLPLLRRRGVPPYTMGSNPFWTCILNFYTFNTY